MSEPAAGSLKSWLQTSSARRIFGRYLSFCASVPVAMIVGPSIPRPIVNMFGGTS